MKLLEQVQSDLNQAVLRYQGDLILQALRERLGELTFGDLRALLTHRLGQALSALKVAELFSTEAVAALGVSAKHASEASPAHKKSPARSQKATKPAGGRKTGKPQAAAKSPKLANESTATVLAVLNSAKKPLSSSQIAAKVKVHRTTVVTILHHLTAAKQVLVTGASKYTRYAKAPPGPGPATAPDRVKPRTRKANDASTRPTAPSSGSADYDAAVLAKLRASDWLSSTELLATVGGSVEEVRAALQRLISAQQVTRAGERKYTRYALWGRTPLTSPTSAGTTPAGRSSAPTKRPRKTTTRKPTSAKNKPPVAKPRVASASLRDEVSAALSAAKQPLSTSDLAERVNAHPVSIRRALLALIDTGRVVTEGPSTRLRYQHVPNGANPPSPAAHDDNGAARRDGNDV